jgi:hypothetical protein
MRNLFDVSRQSGSDQNVSVGVHQIDGVPEGGLLSGRLIALDEKRA